MEKEIIAVGLIAGRHDLPVDEYIFNEEIEDVFDFEKLYDRCLEFICRKVRIKSKFGFGLNQYPDYDFYGPVSVGEKHLHVYVTGLTSVTVALVEACARNGVELTLFHYNRDTNTYVPQKVF